MFVEINDLCNFPCSLWNVVQSVENLTPRGLGNTFSSNVENLEQHSLDSFLISRRRGDESNSDSQRKQQRNKENATKKRGS